MYPASSVSGFYFSHPKSQYFVVGRLSREQVADYAQRRGVPVTQAERWLARTSTTTRTEHRLRGWDSALRWPAQARPAGGSWGSLSSGGIEPANPAQTSLPDS
jgi:hypothetical protein